MPCIPLKVKRRFGEHRLHLQDRKSVKVNDKRTSVDFQLTMRCHVPEDRILYKHVCETLEPYESLLSASLYLRLDQPDQLRAHIVSEIVISKCPSVNTVAADRDFKIFVLNFQRTFH